MIGPLTASIVILVVAGFSSYPHGWALAAFLGAYRIFQDYVLSPHLMSSGMELHPLLVVFGVFAGSFCILDEGCAARRAQHRAADAAAERDVARDAVYSHHPFQEDYGSGAVYVWRDHAGAGRVQARFGEVSTHDATCRGAAAEGATGRVINRIRESELKEAGCQPAPHLRQICERFLGSRVPEDNFAFWYLTGFRFCLKIEKLRAKHFLLGR